ncbi:hypothetical protein DFH08DRAFT_512339 [Mycena albidolilacea]|uniref:Uncharacterized protein n=1 Tax=Mycena albidolilacea TaxID=1033008 RepID=A0AAD6Z3Y4_9AGAR|nr:hypothetical protein DFH08DRAFT_512339 [Mycena albidolilacea]
MGVLFSRIVRDPLVPPVALLYFFDVSPSCRSNAASSQRLRAQSLSPRRPGCRTLQGRTQTGGSRARRPPFLNTRSYRPSAKTTVSPTRRTVCDQSALYYTVLVFIFDAPVPHRRTDFSPHIPSSPYDTRLYRLCPVCSGPPTSTLLADTFVCQRSWGCQQSTAACSCLPVRERPLYASPDRSPPIGAPYELWGIEAEWGRLAVELVGAISPRLIPSSGSGCATTCLKGHLHPSTRSWMGRR